MGKELEGLEPFTPEDVEYLMSLIPNDEADTVVLDVGVHLRPEELDLEALASQLHGITDPIGQLRDWLYDRLKELTSWFADAVNAILQSFWDTVAKPFVDGIRTVVESIWAYLQQVPGTVKSFLEWIQDQISSIWGWIQQYIIDPLVNALSGLSSFISTAVDTITSLITQIPNLISQAIQGAWDWIQTYIIEPLMRAFETLSNWVSQAVDTIAGFFTNTLPSLISQAGRVLQDLIGNVWSWIQDNIVKPLGDAFSRLADMVRSALITLEDFFLDTLPTMIANIAKNIQDLLKGAWEWIQDHIVEPITKAFQSFLGMVSQAISALTDFFTKTLPSYIAQIPRAIQDALRGAWSWIQTNIIEPLAKAVSGIIESVKGGLDVISKYLTEAIPTAISDIAKQLSELPRKAFEAIKVAGMTIWEYITELGRKVSEGFTQLGKYLENVARYLDRVGVAIMGFVNAVANLPSMLYEQFKGLIDTIAKGLKTIGDFFTQLWESLQEFIKDPWGWLRKNIVEPIWSALQWFGGKVLDAFKTLGKVIWDALTGLMKWLIETLGRAFIGVGEWLAGAVNTLLNATFTVAKKVTGMFKWLIEGVLNLIRESITSSLGTISTEWVRRFGQVGYLEASYPSWFTELGKGIGWSILVYLGLVTSQLPLRFLAFAQRGLGKFLGNALPDKEIDLSPLGIGVRLRFNIGKALGATLSNLADVLEDWGNELLRGLTYGGAIWVTRPLTRFFTATFRNILPIEIPALELMITAVRRRLPTQAISNVVDAMAYYLALYGYSDTVLNWFFKLPSGDVLQKHVLPPEIEKVEEYVEIVDRFNTKRYVPTSLIFALPSPSELVRMMIRDVIIDPRYFVKVMNMQGYTRDTSLLYYLLHFRYPSPERLWEFYVRATAGMLWYSPPPPSPESPIWKDVYQLVDIYGLGKDYIPLRPIDLNVTGKEVLDKHLEAMTRYFKWHDYAPFSWIPKYTSDRFMMFDLMADIPTKIDMRWMTRWGLIQQIGTYIQDLTTFTFDKVIGIIKGATGRELYSERPTGKIVFDVRLFAKLLQATGLHPYWVPIVSVAEAINALTDERTLLRTGIINMFKEGLANIVATESLMSGLFITEFRTAYFNQSSGKWEEITWKVPVVWLPAERTLLQMRAIMDRTLDIYREFYRGVIRGIRTLVVKPDEGESMIRSFASTLLTYTSSELKTVTGIEPKLAIDERYISLWRRYAEILSEIETRERIRYYTYRLMAWLFYRITYGWVTKEDVEKVTSDLVKYAYLTEKEKKVLETIFEDIVGIVRREYVPTPTQLATLSEYLVIPEDLIKKAFDERRIPEEWRPIWIKYISIRPIASDVRSLLSDYFRVRRYGVAVPKEVEDKVRELAKEVGFTEREWSIKELEVGLEALASDASRYRQLYEPTYSFLATLSEYVDIDLIEGFKEFLNEWFNRIKALGVPEVMITAVKKYISVRPVKSDYKSLITVAIRAYRLGVIGRDELEEVIKRAVDYGFTSRELEILWRRIELEVLIEQSRQYIPTPSMLATLSEYLVIPEELIKQVLIARRVPKEWVNIWLTYIKVRPVKSDYRSLLYTAIRAFREGLIPEAKLKEYLERAKNYGFTDVELEILKERVGLEVLIEWSRQYIPGLGTLASMAEYIEVPEELINKVLTARRVPKEFAQLWIKYVEARTISREVNEVVAQYRRLYEYFHVTPDITNQVKSLMLKGGWVGKEIEIFNFSLQLRKAYRVMAYLIPTIRGFVADAMYLGDWERLFNDLLKARGIDVAKYQKQIEYYKKLIKSRKVGRRISWYITRVMHAYTSGVIDRATALAKLQRLKIYGLDDEEIALIMDGLELEKAYIQKVYGGGGS